MIKITHYFNLIFFFFFFNTEQWSKTLTQKNKQELTEYVYISRAFRFAHIYTAVKSQNTVKPNPLYADFPVTSATSRDAPLAQIPLRRLPRNFPSMEVSGKSA